MFEEEYFMTVILKEMVFCIVKKEERRKGIVY